MPWAFSYIDVSDGGTICELERLMMKLMIWDCTSQAFDSISNQSGKEIAPCATKFGGLNYWTHEFTNRPSLLLGKMEALISNFFS